MIRQIYYISTGAKAAMFTLRMTRRSDDAALSRFMPDSYLCNLAAAGDEGTERAILKANEYVDAMRERIGETDDFKIEFGGIWDDATNIRRGKLSTRETMNLELIEAGIFPFGKNAGKRIEDAEPNYILYFADQSKTADNIISAALCAACQGVALEKGYIAKRDQARAERRAIDERSEFVGSIGERREFTGQIISSVWKKYEYLETGFFITKIRCGEYLVTYIGSSNIGERDETITFKGTIKAHQEYQGIKSTVINRPHVKVPA